jgi:hypothetical protein
MLSWLDTLSCLLLLALNTAFQPAGRVLGISAGYGVYLRFSPLICAADALSLLAHLFAYRITSKNVPLPEALLLIRRQRFDEAEIEINTPGQESLKANAIRALKTALHVLWFVFFVFRPAFVISLWTGPWMAAWALMCATSYAVLGTASWYMRRQLEDFAYAPVAGGAHDDMLDAEEEGGIRSPTLLDPDTATSTDPASPSEIPALQARLAHTDTILLRLAVTFQALLLLWSLICLVQPLLNQHILSSTSPSIDIPLYILSLPLIYGCLALILFASIALGYCLLQVVTAAGKWVKRQLPDSIMERGGVVVDVLFLGMAGCAGIVGFFGGSQVVAQVLLSEEMQWIYRAVALDALIVVLALGICSACYVLLRATFRYHAAFLDTCGMAHYLNEESSALLACWLISVIVVVLWFRFRYDTSGDWMQEWRDALKDGRTGNSTTID